MSGIICFLRYLLMKITCAMRDAISTTRVMSRAGLRGRLGDIDGVRIGRLVQHRACDGHVRFGSKADICAAKSHVRFTPESGHFRSLLECPLAIRALWRRSLCH
jgi:hypothetical protein